MKKVIIISSILILIAVECFALSNKNTKSSLNRTDNLSSNGIKLKTKILFINASQHKDGNTVNMGKQILQGINYDQIDLVDYQINQLGQKNRGDQFDTVLSSMKETDIIVIGTPVYWHTVSGSLKVLLDRFYEYGSDLKNKKLIFFYQGSAPSTEARTQIEYMMTRFAKVMDMDLISIAKDSSSITKANAALKNIK